MTKVACAVRALVIVAISAISMTARAQEAAPAGWATKLYRQIQTVGLDPNQVYLIRDAFLEREDLHIRLQDGTIAFTREVDGHITGAVFEGSGEVLLMPPDRVERWSLSVFTDAAIFEERFTLAYLRFNDDTFQELLPKLRPADDAEGFLAKWEPLADELSRNLAIRLVETFVNGTVVNADGSTTYTRDPGDRVLLARVIGVHSGAFDLFYDSKAAEQIGIARLAQVDGKPYYDVWTSFPGRARRNAIRQKENRTSNPTITTQAGAEAFLVDSLRIDGYKLLVNVVLPSAIEVNATLNIESRRETGRFLTFELSRFLKVSEVTASGSPTEFIQNEALRGTDLARRGNDLVSIILPKGLEAGERLQLRFVYKGDVLADAGGGLMYVGQHGDWYPNRGVGMSNYDIEFHYPTGWTLVATGQAVRGVQQSSSGEQISRWTSERPMPFAGFNLGRYVKEGAKAGSVLVDAYATHGVESAMKQREAVVVIPSTRPLFGRREDIVVSSVPPSPSSNAQRVAKEGARTIDFYSQRMGPYPYSSLALTQMPGPDSQSWPGLIYLSSYVYLTPEERAAARVSPLGELLYQNVMEAHEIGHQWWGNLLIWRSYREQWIVEALSNYCALLKLESEDENKFRKVMASYRDDLLAKNEKGVEFSEAGPVTLGRRLNSSRFPEAYNTISYGRGTWLFHMLRTMLLMPGAGGMSVKAGSPDEPFFRALRRLRASFEGREITTRDVQKVFEEELPPQLQYEGRKSLDWFFDGWVNGTSIPKFQLSDVKLSNKTGATVATGKIIVKDGTDDLVTSVPLYAATGSRSSVLAGRVFAEGPETQFRLTVPPGTKKIQLDPNGTILARP